MELFQRINLLINEQNLSKKEFALKLIALEPKLKSTGEAPTVKAVYAYLSGTVALKTELIPYIAEVLDIPEQLLFDDSPRMRRKYLDHILKSVTSQEKELLQSRLCKNKSSKAPSKDIYDLLIYAPDFFLQKLERTLRDYKSMTDKFK